MFTNDTRPTFTPTIHKLLISLVLLSRAATLSAEPAPDAAPALPGAEIPIVVSADCLGAEPDNLTAALARCHKANVNIVKLTVVQTEHRTLVVTQPAGKTYTRLAQVLAISPAPKLLLQVTPAMLDDVLAEVYSAKAAERVLIEPLIQRPLGQSSPETIAQGIRYWRMQRSTPRQMMIHVLEIDLQKPNMEFVVRSNTALQKGFESTAQKVSDSVLQLGLTVAINGSYFRPFNGGHLIDKAYVPAAGQAVEIDGILIDASKQISGYESMDERANAAICIQGKAVSILNGHCPENTEMAVGAGPILLQGGVVEQMPVENRPYYHMPHPRTAVGLDQSQQKLWMVVVDGRQENYSNGITLPELANLLKELGASTAINMDGGGSSTMVSMLNGVPKVMNSPIHTGIPGRERPVGNLFGLRFMQHF